MQELDIKGVAWSAVWTQGVSSDIPSNDKKLRNVLTSPREDISISSDAPNIQILSAVHNGQQISSLDIEKSRLYHPFRVDSCRNEFARIERILGWQLAVSKFVVGINSQFASRSIPNIDPLRAYSPVYVAKLIGMGNPSKPRIVHISSRTSDHRNLRGVSSIRSGFSKTLSAVSLSFGSFRNRFSIFAPAFHLSQLSFHGGCLRGHLLQLLTAIYQDKSGNHYSSDDKEKLYFPVNRRAVPFNFPATPELLHKIIGIILFVITILFVAAMLHSFLKGNLLLVIIYFSTVYFLLFYSLQFIGPSAYGEPSFPSFLQQQQGP